MKFHSIKYFKYFSKLFYSSVVFKEHQNYNKSSFELWEEGNDVKQAEFFNS